MPARSPPSNCLVFSHANGYPAGTYRVLFERWRAAGWRVLALPMLGHDPLYQVTSGWPQLRDQLVDFISTQAPGRRVQLVGHSLGGFLSLMVACRKPALAAGVVMIDSPLITGWKAHSLNVAKLTGLMGRISGAAAAKRRRWRWPHAEAAHAHYAAKALFARWDPRVLRDYIAAGTEPHAEGGVQLAFRREVEARIYDTLPHHLGTLLQRHPPQCPVGYVGGTQSLEGRRVGLAGTRAVTRGRIEWVEGTHLLPMERPEATADAVLRLIGPPPGHAPVTPAPP